MLLRIPYRPSCGSSSLLPSEVSSELRSRAFDQGGKDAPGVVQSFVTVADLSGNAGTIHFANSASAGVLTQITNSGAIAKIA